MPWHPVFARLCAALALGTAALLAHAADKGAPPTAVKPVVDTYGDLRVSDPYRWLEATGDPAVRRWSAAQDRRTRAYLDKLPARKPMFDWLMKQAAASSSAYYGLHAAGGRLFALHNQPPRQQPMLVVMGQEADPAQARVVLDPNALNPKGTTAIDWFVPSPTGKLVAVSMSENGSEDGSLHVFDVATGREVDAVIPDVQYPTGGGSLAWREDGSGFWYTRYPGADAPAERRHFYQQVYEHRIGDDPAKDRYVLGRDFPRVAEIVLEARPGTPGVVVSVGNGDGGEFAHYLIGKDGGIRQVTRFEDKVVAAALGPDALYLVSHDGAPRGKVLKLGLDDLALAHAQVLVPESDGALQPGGESGAAGITVTRDALLLREIVGGPSRVAVYGLDGRPRGHLALPEVATVDELEAMDDGSLLVAVKTYLEPPRFVRFASAGGEGKPTLLRQTSPLSFGDVEVVREFATSRDGTRIPLNIVRRKGMKLDGRAPLLLNGYGGYNVSQVPRFLGAATRMWLDAGGVYVVANLRGGGEFGEDWHAQGALTHKQNVFDDFAAAAQYLVERGYTSHRRMAAIGGSNGGLLMGATLTQHPQLLRAVVSTVGIYDMLRVELDPNGAFNVSEFGSVKVPEQLAALYAYSPYHHVQDGARYPAVLMATGETDGRVNPMHSRKMIARLQAATGSGRPVLLSINTHAGHGMGSSLSIRVNQAADIYAFLFDQLGMAYRPGR
ncbi:prolyl oligopeptidase family serine peptidase [Pelomonas sp. P7]|uniref:prolyl oligopeptidase n=1 Tax=Pelomonas caseinilytica TaxID=2906763 RepID=A0ABS8XH91_9BURK|nr:prolyl oligopeptidase family serine peptidase [Pelomonas sp. P7]MCE4538897.1 prolyl oligopeptidase family serine peptidase [Pelomonas sp. P7]